MSRWLIHPVEEYAALYAFLGLSYEDSMLRFHEGRTPDWAWSRRETSLASRYFRPARLKSQMTLEQVERFEAAAGGLLDELGYARAVPCPGLKSLERASRIRSLLGEDPEWIQFASHPPTQAPLA